MTNAVANILSQVESLSSQERAELAYAVLCSLDPEEAGVEEAWDEELARRVARIRSGEAKGKPAEQVLAEWRNRS